MADRRVHLVANSHIDPVWLWDKHEGIDEVINTFRSACDRLDEYPELKFSASSACFYKWVEDYAPDVFERVRRHVRSGRWEITGGWWVETDCNLPGAESFRKSAEISRRYIEGQFGVDVLVGYSPDSFGHPATLPKILSETGFRYYIFCRPDQSENLDLPDGVFHWEYEGHRVLCYRVPYHYTQGSPPTRTRVDQALSDESLAAGGVGCFMFGVGDHGGGPAKAEIEYLIVKRAEMGSPQLVFSTCLEFFQEAEKLPNIPVVTGDLHIHAVGCYSVNRNIKEAIRRAENALCYTQRAMAMSGDGDSRRLDDLWQTTIFNQFHDIMPGSCAPQAASQALAELGGVSASALDISYRALRRLSSSIPVSCPQGDFRIANTLPYAVTGPLEIESWPYFKEGALFRDSLDRHIPIQEITPSVMCANHRWLLIDTIPANTMKSYHFAEVPDAERAEPHSYVFSAGDAVEMNGLRIEAPGHIYCNGVPCLRSPISLGVIPDHSDTWSHGLSGYGPAGGYFEQIESSMNTGPLASTLISRQQYGGSSAELIFRIYQGLPFIDMEVRVCWLETRALLKLELNLPAQIGALLTQGAGGAITKTKECTEEPLHGWLSVGDVTVLQRGAFAFDWNGTALRVTLVRSSLYGYVDGWPIDMLGPLQPTDIGEHRFRFRILPGRFAADEMDRLHAAFEEPFNTMRENAHPAPASVLIPDASELSLASGAKCPDSA